MSGESLRVLATWLLSCVTSCLTLTPRQIGVNQVSGMVRYKHLLSSDYYDVICRSCIFEKLYIFLKVHAWLHHTKHELY